MKRIGIAYASSDDHTRTIASYMAARVSGLGFDVEVWNVKKTTSDRSLNAFDAVILAASVRAGKHQAEMVKFVKRHLKELEATPSAFVSVSLSQAGVERPGTPDEHARFAASVQEVLTRFFHDTNWHPKTVKPVAGACLYTRYNFLIRMIMKRISRQAGGSTDTTRDHEYTNWAELDRFIEVFTKLLLTPKTSCEYRPAEPVGAASGRA